MCGRLLRFAETTIPSNLAWKDTVLVRPVEMVDILLDVTNPASGWRTATLPNTPRAG